MRRVFGSDDESSEGEEGGLGEASHPSRSFPGGTPWTAETPETLQTSPPPPVRFLAPDRERHVGPLADSIPGLHLARGALTHEAQAWLLNAIRKEGLVEFPDDTSPEVCVAGNVAREAPSREYEEPYETTRHTSPHENTSRKNVHAKSFRKNQAMRFGNFPPWAAVLAERVARVAAEDGAWPARSSAEAAKGNAFSGEDEKKRKKKPGALPFDQFIVNAYEPGEGLKPHVDLAAFDDGVCVVSLLSSTVMDLSPAEKDAETAKVIDDDGRKKKNKKRERTRGHRDPPRPRGRAVPLRGGAVAVAARHRGARGGQAISRRVQRAGFPGERHAALSAGRGARAARGGERERRVEVLSTFAIRRGRFYGEPPRTSSRESGGVSQALLGGSFITCE